MTDKRVHLMIEGKVQGVFYRDFVKKEAESLDITGFVKNLNDGKVEVVAEGESGNVDKLLEKCKKGPLMAFIADIETKEEKPTNEFDGFDIRH
jgi:acylphosphatase